MKSIGIGNLYEIVDYTTRTISPENRTGEKGKAAAAIPNPEWPARNLGVGWKCSPYIEIEAGETTDLAFIQDSGLIQSFWITGEVDRGLILRMYWDDQVHPAVEVPLTDFFLYGYAKAHRMENWQTGPLYTVNSALVCVNPNRGLNCFFQMPFKKNARISLENRSSLKKGVYYQINYAVGKHEGPIGYFHAQYRDSMPVGKGKVHTLLDGIKGQGHYIGTAMYVGLNRNRDWWGEGEFKFYIDGDEDFPTIASTGLEDYFGGAFNWDTEGAYIPYNTQYMGMPHIERPDGLYEIQQRFSLYRWHVLDPIRFKENLKVTVQCLGWKMSDDGVNKDFLQRQDDYMTVSYWYQDKLDQNDLVLLPNHDELMAF
jgi:hypothetical protein